MDATATYPKLQAHTGHIPHLKELLDDATRTDALSFEHGGILVDFSRQQCTTETLSLLLDLARERDLEQSITSMFHGTHINQTEDRAVLHVALRARRDATIFDRGENVVPQVWAVLDKMKAFSNKVREGAWLGVTGKKLTHVVAIGIGGSYLGPAFVHTALENDPEAFDAARGRKLTFLANVDPVDCVNALKHADPETTLAVIVSKTFTTAETMRNARTVRAWFKRRLGDASIAKHMVAVSTNLEGVEAFGIDPENAFGFWDWVGGRFSVSSAVGALPLSLQYGFDVFESFLEGMRNVDEHFASAPLEKNIPVLMGLFNVWNATFLKRSTCAILPYAQALSKFPAHVQQLSMESNGKGVDMAGNPLSYQAGEIDFGEAGTNGQHSFYQLVHQGRVVPAEFIGVLKSQADVYLSEEASSSHEELLCNFFAQPDALAVGKTAENAHRNFEGNRPSLSLLLPVVNAFTVGQLLALYEHRVAVSGFLWGINSFDQWGVELGKVLAGQVRSELIRCRTDGAEVSDSFNYSTRKMLSRYLECTKGSTSSERVEFPHMLELEIHHMVEKYTPLLGNPCPRSLADEGFHDHSTETVMTPRTRRSKLSLLISSIGLVLASIAFLATLTRWRIDARSMAHDSAFAFDRNTYEAILRRNPKVKHGSLPRPLGILVAEEDILSELDHILAERGMAATEATRDRAAVMIKLASAVEEDLKRAGIRAQERA